MSRVHVATLLSLFTLACVKDGEDRNTAGFESLTTGPGDGDGDATTGDGDGDGDPTTGDGDGDGDPTSGDGDGDGDGDTGDGDGDTGEPNEGCSDGGDSGNAPFEDQGVYQSPDDEEDDPLGGFIPDQDFGGVDECNIFLQDCPVDEKCVPYASNGGSWDANKCVPVMGDGMVGESCLWGGVIEATDDCDQNSACWSVNNQGMGTCTAFCEGTTEAPVCPQGTACIQGNNGSIAFCVSACNPITQDCPNGEACFWGGSSFTCTATSSDIELGQPCGFINDCAEGSMCITADALPNCNGTSCCAQFCDLDCGAGTCSQPGTTCTAFFDGNAPTGSEDIGVCLAN